MPGRAAPLTCRARSANTITPASHPGLPVVDVRPCGVAWPSTREGPMHALLLLAVLPAAAPKPNASAAPADAGFERHVRPLLVEHCLGCHGPKKQMGGLRL